MKTDYIVNSAIQKKKARQAFTSVFCSCDPFTPAFTHEIERRAVLYPVEYKLDQTQMEAVYTAAKKVGDSGFFLRITETGDNCLESTLPVLYFPLEEYSHYLHYVGIQFILENALYSPSGKWGIMISHEQHAVVGGSCIFVESLFKALPEIEYAHRKRFMEFWIENKMRFNSEIDWIRTLFFHLYGKKLAREYLESGGI